MQKSKITSNNEPKSPRNNVFVSANSTISKQDEDFLKQHTLRSGQLLRALNGTSLNQSVKIDSSKLDGMSSNLSSSKFNRNNIQSKFGVTQGTGDGFFKSAQFENKNILNDDVMNYLDPNQNGPPIAQNQTHYRKFQENKDNDVRKQREEFIQNRTKMPNNTFINLFKSNGQQKQSKGAIKETNDDQISVETDSNKRDDLSSDDKEDQFLNLKINYNSQNNRYNSKTTSPDYANFNNNNKNNYNIQRKQQAITIVKQANMHQNDQSPILMGSSIVFNDLTQTDDSREIFPPLIKNTDASNFVSPRKDFASTRQPHGLLHQSLQMSLSPPMRQSYKMPAINGIQKQQMSDYNPYQGALSSSMAVPSANYLIKQANSLQPSRNGGKQFNTLDAIDSMAQLKQQQHKVTHTPVQNTSKKYNLLSQNGNNMINQRRTGGGQQRPIQLANNQFGVTKGAGLQFTKNRINSPQISLTEIDTQMIAVVKGFNQAIKVGKQSQEMHWLKKIRLRSNIFSNISFSSFKLLIETSNLINLKNGEFLYKKSERIQSIFFILYGQIKVSWQRNANHPEYQVGECFGSGDVLGDEAFDEAEKHLGYKENAKCVTKDCCVLQSSVYELQNLRRKGFQGKGQQCILLQEDFTYLFDLFQGIFEDRESQRNKVPGYRKRFYPSDYEGSSSTETEEEDDQVEQMQEQQEPPPPELFTEFKSL